MSDFISRLLARSSGERVAVRPHILPAFAPSREDTESLPVGEVLRGAQQTLRAIAPFPSESAAQARPINAGPETSSTVQSPALHSAAFPLGSRTVDQSGWEQQKNEDSEARASVLKAVQKETVVLAKNSQDEPLPSPKEKPRIGIEPTQIEPEQLLPVQRLAVSREAKEEAKAVSKPAGLAPAPQILPLLRPAVSKSDTPLEPSRKSTAEPIIQVTIGKIEVRASIAGAKSFEKKKPASAISLEEYQRQRTRRSAV